MPERVTREERVISMTIEKARQVKELLRESMEGNRLPDEKDNRMEKVNLKRPKAEKDKTKMENNTGTHSGYGKAGETTQFKKMNLSIGTTNYAKDLGESIQFGNYPDESKNAIVPKSRIPTLVEEFNKTKPVSYNLKQITGSAGPTDDFIDFVKRKM